MLLTNVVERLFPLSMTCESEKKLVPFTVTACPELPTSTLVGDILRRIGRLEEL